MWGEKEPTLESRRSRAKRQACRTSRGSCWEDDRKGRNVDHCQRICCTCELCGCRGQGPTWMSGQVLDAWQGHRRTHRAAWGLSPDSEEETGAREVVGAGRRGTEAEKGGQGEQGQLSLISSLLVLIRHPRPCPDLGMSVHQIDSHAPHVAVGPTRAPTRRPRVHNSLKFELPRPLQPLPALVALHVPGAACGPLLMTSPSPLSLWV